MFNLEAIHFNPKEFHPYYQNYIDKRSSNDIIEGLRIDKENFIHFLEQIPSEKWGFTYDKGKWTVAEVISHIIDTERIFSYRALRFARGDKTALAGFDQDFYAVNSNANKISLKIC